MRPPTPQTGQRVDRLCRILLVFVGGILVGRYWVSPDAPDHMTVAPAIVANLQPPTPAWIKERGDSGIGTLAFNVMMARAENQALYKRIKALETSKPTSRPTGAPNPGSHGAAQPSDAASNVISDTAISDGGTTDARPRGKD